MTTAAPPTSAPPAGGTWLLEATPPETVFTPERLSDEQRLIHATADEFVAREVIDQNDRLETKDWDLARRLLRRCGELGLLGTDVPEAYGGVGLDKVSSALIAGSLGHAGSFSTAFGAQTGLVIMPIRAFGTEDQKRRYLPGLVSGDTVGAYCLSESGSGSDALGAKTRATRQPDGSFVLNGEKMWITNGGFADVYIVFAKVDGERFTAFIVERAFEGVTSGAEEHKMGLLGSSTTPVILRDARVPAGNVLGEIGRGHIVAFSVLNYGRFKLAASTVGGARHAIGEAAAYAADRRQFGKPIAGFGAIRHKLGEMAVRTYAVEAMTFRTAGLLDAAIAGSDEDRTLVDALEEYAVESSILKVAGSEALHYVLDENVQIHGGNGYVRDYPAERHYRDSRVNRIFEGTNEINRLLIPGRLIRLATKGRLPLVAAARALRDELTAGTRPPEPGDAPLDAARSAVGMFKKTALAVIGLSLERYGEKVGDEQEVLSAAADILIDTYAAESAVVRAGGAAAAGAAEAGLHVEAARAYVNDAALRIEVGARSALAALAEGDALRTHLAALRRLLKVPPINTVVIRRALADKVVERGRYVF